MPYKSQNVAVIIPAFNEEHSIGGVVSGLGKLVHNCSPIVDFIMVCDNASTDGTGKVAAQAGANVCYEFRQGYGYACLRALTALERFSDIDIVVFVDGDSSVELSEFPDLLESIIAGNDLVVGSRVTQKQEQYALGRHQMIGNKIASALIRGLWGVQMSDLGPFRAMRYKSLRLLNMQDQRFGWTVEMQVKAIQANMRYAEVSVSTKRRIGKSKISGTIKGTVGAFFGIFGKIAHLHFRQTKFQLRVRRARILLDDTLQKSHNPPL